MTDQLLIFLAVAIVIAIVLQIVLLVRKPRRDLFDELHDRLERRLHDESVQSRETITAKIGEESQTNRAELRGQLKDAGDVHAKGIETLRDAFHAVTTQSREVLDSVRKESKDDAEKFRDQISTQQNNLQQTLLTTLQDLTTKNEGSLTQVRSDLQTSQQSLQQTLSALRDNNSQSLKEVRVGLQQSLETLQRDNAEKLEKMRETVDEKLQATLQARIGESFKQVSDNLADVQRGLGEMRELATGVGDLKRVLTNVKDRGTFGETQLAMLLEQVLTREQYIENAETIPGSGNRVEFAIKMPGQGMTADGYVLLPIDAKFPREDYDRLRLAHEAADASAIAASSAALERVIRNEAKKINEKYVEPPRTTDFAILFLPTEGLYAEALSRPGLFEDLQRLYKVTIAGPTTLLAILNALQMGFRSLAIEKRSSEMWERLGAAKTEFGKFGAMIDKANSHIANAQKTLTAVGTRTKAVERKLREVESTDQAGKLLDFSDDLDFREDNDLS